MRRCVAEHTQRAVLQTQRAALQLRLGSAAVSWVASLARGCYVTKHGTAPRNTPHASIEIIAGSYPLRQWRPFAPTLLPLTGAVQVEELRLAGGPSPSEGRVELRLANSSEWGTLCGTSSTGLDTQLAQVVCRELGFEPSRALARGGGIYGSGGLQDAAATVECTGEEDSLENCIMQLESQGSECGSPATVRGWGRVVQLLR